MNFLIAGLLVLSLEYSGDQNLNFWIQKLRSPSQDLKINALQKLGEIRSQSAVPHIADALNSDNPSVRYHAALAMGRHTYPKSMDILSDRLVLEKDVYVKGEIRRSISLLKDYFSQQEAEAQKNKKEE